MALLFDTRLTGGLAGKSAYEYAQEGGYKGSEADFTESLGDMGDIGITLTTTLPSGEGSLTLTDERITADSTLNAVYTSKFGMSVKSAVFEEGSLTIEFPSQDEDVDIKVVINANLALGGNGKSAYDYAVDGGYQGTEEDFAELLGGLSNTVSDITMELNTKATITSGTTDLTAGTSELASGTIYCVYE